jgi:glycine/D-amino acid oxidase-like deaminating enzyme
MDTTSPWIASASLPRYPKLGKDLTVDVVIVGGGITGITAAYLCKKAGLTFALLERDRLARLATGLTTAHLTSVTDLRLFELVENLDRHAASAVWDGGAAATDQIVDHIRTDNISCDFRRLSGWLHSPDTDPPATVVDELLKEAATARRLGVTADFTPDTPVFRGPGIEFSHQAVFHPRKYLAGLVRSFGGKGTHVFEQTTVDEVQEHPLAIKAGGFTVQCAHVILATHAPLLGKVGALAALMLPARLAIHTTYALAAQLPAQRAEGLFWNTDAPYDYLRIEHRRGHDLTFFGGEDRPGPPSENAPEPYRRLEQRLLGIFPDAKIFRRWSGQIVETDDGLPFIGSAAANQFVATGFSGNGLTFGTLAAMMAIDAITGRRNSWAEIFNVHRKAAPRLAPNRRRKTAARANPTAEGGRFPEAPLHATHETPALG